MKNYFKGLFLSLLVLFVGCKEDYFYQKKYDFSNSTWDYKDTLNYSFEVKDTMRIYCMALDVAHTTDFQTQNIYIKLSTQFPDGHRKTQQRSIELMTKSGYWIGERSGNVWTKHDTLISDAYFNRPGTYTITVEQFMRTNPLPHVKSISLWLQDTKQNRKNK